LSIPESLDTDINGGNRGAQVVFGHSLRFAVHYHTALRASALLHGRMFDSVTHAPLAFFESIAVGQLASRFSSDVEKIDADMPVLVLGLMDGCLSTLRGDRLTEPLWQRPWVAHCDWGCHTTHVGHSLPVI
jgi:hypothetical protein